MQSRAVRASFLNPSSVFGLDTMFQSRIVDALLQSRIVDTMLQIRDVRAPFLMEWQLLNYGRTGVPIDDYFPINGRHTCCSVQGSNLQSDEPKLTGIITICVPVVPRNPKCISEPLLRRGGALGQQVDQDCYFPRKAHLIVLSSTINRQRQSIFSGIAPQTSSHYSFPNSRLLEQAHL